MSLMFLESFLMLAWMVSFTGLSMRMWAIESFFLSLGS